MSEDKLGVGDPIYLIDEDRRASEVTPDKYPSLYKNTGTIIATHGNTAWVIWDYWGGGPPLDGDLVYIDNLGRAS